MTARVVGMAQIELTPHSGPKEPLYTHVPRGTKEELRLLAQAEGISMASLVGQLLTSALRIYKEEHP